MTADNQRRVGVGVGVVVADGDQLLLIRRVNAHGAGTWSTPGGHLDFGESLAECAVRETREETGVEIGNVRFRAVTNDVFDLEDLHYITVWMDAEYIGGEARVTAPGETTEVRWFRSHDLPQPLFLPLRNLLQGNCHPRHVS